MNFDCSGCGLCCRKDPSGNGIPDEFFKEDGWCKHLQEDMSCGIYETRPLLCNIKRSWEEIPEYVTEMTGATTEAEFHLIIHEGCDELKKADGQEPRK